MEYFVSLFNFDILKHPTVAAVVMLMLFVTVTLSAKSLIDALLILMITVIFILYYLDGIADILSSANNGIITNGTSILRNLKVTLLSNVPNFNGFELFGVRIFEISGNIDHVMRIRPIVVYIVGIAIRFVGGEYLGNDETRQVIKSYWLAITSFVVLTMTLTDFIGLDWYSAIAVFIFHFAVQNLRLPDEIASAQRKYDMTISPEK